MKYLSIFINWFSYIVLIGLLVGSIYNIFAGTNYLIIWILNVCISLFVLTCSVSIDWKFRKWKNKIQKETKELIYKMRLAAEEEEE